MIKSPRSLLLMERKPQQSGEPAFSLQLQPTVSDMTYILDQHLLLSVKSCDGFESYGML